MNSINITVILASVSYAASLEDQQLLTLGMDNKVAELVT